MAQEITEDMTGKFTPGPWGIFHLADDVATYGENAGKPIICTKDFETEICGVIQREEDAKLIAKAPEMFHLLNDAKQFIQDLLDTGYELQQESIDKWFDGYNKIVIEVKC